MADELHQQRILILDFGSQTTQLIARRVRESGVYCEIHPWHINEEQLRDFGAKGIILSGGPESVVASGAPVIPAVVWALGVPVLGICYGMQAMVHQLGGEVRAQATESEFGHATVSVTASCELFRNLTDEQSSPGTEHQQHQARTGISDTELASRSESAISGQRDQAAGSTQVLDVWMSHGDKVTRLPPDFSLIGTSDNAPVAIIADESRHRYGLQFHPEVTHTRHGARMLERFVREVCQCDGLWTAANIIEDSMIRIRDQVGTEQVLLGLSGGVDSSVVAALLHRAIGQQLTCVFVDNGLLRLNEAEQVMQTFSHAMGVTVIHVDASQRFLTALAGITDPEEKRKIIGRVFVEVFEEEADKLVNVQWLAQGTIYPDVIESAASASGSAHLIKSHHNVGGLPSEMRLKLLEPLRELFKDEVRKLGKDLGLPDAMVYRHPFPGPGLGVRILGEVQAEYADILRQADDLFIQALREHELYDKVSQAFAVFLPVKSVGVTGDGRRHDYVIALRAVETIDFMTARAAQLPWDFLERVARDICNTIPRVSRVTYDISSKPPATIEWE